MRALAVVAVGLLVAFLDLQINDVDLAPDPLGWAVAGLALLSLRGLHAAFRTGAVAAFAGMLLGLPAVVGPEGPVLGLVVGLVETVVVFASCTAIGALLPTSSVGRLALVLRWVDLALLVALTLVTVPSMGDGSLDGVLVAVGALLVLAALAVFVTFVAVLFLASRRSPEPVG